MLEDDVHTEKLDPNVSYQSINNLVNSSFIKNNHSLSQLAVSANHGNHNYEFKQRNAAESTTRNLKVLQDRMAQRDSNHKVTQQLNRLCVLI